jgi:signal transduction histidine kinase
VTRPRLPRLTIRARLTLVYGGLFLLAGVLLLGVTYVLVSQQVPVGNQTTVRGTAGTGAPQVTDTQGQTLVTDTVRATRHDALTALLTQGGIALLVVGAAAIAFGWLIAGRLLRPLHQVTETARRIADAPAADRGLHERIPLDGADDEIRELAGTFNVMLERLDHSFDGQRRFIANASHELRTPLTLNRTLLEVALEQDTVSPEMRQLGATLLKINGRNERLIDGLLLLARSEREPMDRSYVDLADIVEHVTAQVPRGPVTVTAVAAEAATAGNPVLLERLVQNLVDNGIRHNLDGDGWVHVSTGTRPDGAAAVEVANTGPVVPRYEIPSLFEPFRRLRQSPPGTGLGLSIVRAIARAHGGTVVADPREGGGLVVTVRLPPPDAEVPAPPAGTSGPG